MGQLELVPGFSDGIEETKRWGVRLFREKFAAKIINY
jgi:hypothetical protein